MMQLVGFKERNMKKLLVTLALTSSMLMGCQTVHADPPLLNSGTLLGGIIGGAVGNTIGKGSGRKAATIGGVIVGSMLGNDWARTRHHHHYRRARIHPHYYGPSHLPPPRYAECSFYMTYGERRACHRGVQRRERERQWERERYAYENGYSGSHD